MSICIYIYMYSAKEKRNCYLGFLVKDFGLGDATRITGIHMNKTYQKEFIVLFTRMRLLDSSCNFGIAYFK